MGYFAPRVWEWLFRSYAPAWTSVLYALMFVGLYMTMLYTVVYGWGKYKKNPYKNIISRGMMKFQARQTVNNMLVVTLLIAGAALPCFICLPPALRRCLATLTIRMTIFISTGRIRKCRGRKR